MTSPHRLGTLVAFCLAVAATVMHAPWAPAAAQQPPAPRPGAAPLAATTPAAARATVARQALRYEAGTGGVIALPGAAANVFVADPRVAEVRPASATTLFIFGVGAGRTTVAAVDTSGASIAEYDVFVRPAAYASTEAEATIARVMPGSRIRVAPQSKGLLLSGTAATAEEAARAIAIARGFLAENQTVEDQLVVASPLQVTLRVRIAEVQRSVTRNLGIDWQALGVLGNIANLPAAVVSVATGASIATGSTGLAARGLSFNGLIDLLAQDNLARVLAEPNLTVISGSSASFLAGGEYPVPVGQQNGVISIEFKKFGVNLTFLPTVLSDGRINMKVSPEVSQLSDDSSVNVVAGGLSFRVPGLQVRRADTTVELGSGQSFAIAGLLQDSLRQADKALPGIGEIPILGALFRSDRFQRNETELVILITPYIVRPVNDPNALRLAGENYSVPNDRERLLLLRQNGSAAGPGPTPTPLAPGRAGRPGFILQ